MVKEAPKSRAPDPVPLTQHHSIEFLKDAS